jgi:hypothetical protein
VRLHFRTLEGHGFYFEITRQVGVPVQEAYARERAHMEERLAGAQVSPLRRAREGGRAAWAFDLTWDHGERRVLLVEQGGALYRVVYDPRSPLNEQAVATLRFEG